MKKSLKILLGVFIVIIFAGFITVNFFLKGIIVKNFNKSTPMTLELSSLRLNIFAGKVTAKGVVIDNQEEKEILSLEKASVNISILDLIKKKIHIEDASLYGTVANLDNLSTSTSDAPTEESKAETTSGGNETSTEPTSSLNVVVDRFFIDSATLTSGGTTYTLNEETTFDNILLNKDSATTTLDGMLSMGKEGSIKVGLNLDNKENSIKSNLVFDNFTPFLLIKNSKGKEFVSSQKVDGSFDVEGNLDTLISTGTGKFTITDAIFKEKNKENYFLKGSVNLDIPKFSSTKDSDGKVKLMYDATGNLEVDLTSEILDLLLSKSGEDIDASVGNAYLSGDFKGVDGVFSFDSTLKIDKVVVNETKVTPYNVNLDLLKGNINASGTFKDYNLFSDLEVSNLLYSDNSNNSLSFPTLKAIVEATPKNATLKTLDLSNGSVVTKEVALNDIALKISNLSQKNANGKVSLNTNLSTGGNISADVNVKGEDLTKTDSLSVAGKASVKSFPLSSVKSFLKDFSDELSGSLTSNINLNYSGSTAVISGSSSINSLKYKSKDIDISSSSLSLKHNVTSNEKGLDIKNSSVSFKNFKGTPVDGIYLNLPSGSIGLNYFNDSEVNLSSLSLSSPVITMSSSSSSKSSSTPATTSTGNSQESSSSDKGATNEKPLRIRLKKGSITSGKVIQKVDGKTTTIKDISLAISNFDTNKNQKSYVNLKASLDGITGLYIKGNLSLNESGNFDPKKMNFDGKLGVGNVNLAKASQNSTLNEVDFKGTLKSDGNLTLKSGKINSTNEVTVSNIKADKKSSSTKALAVEKLINTVGTKKDSFDLTIPVEADLNDPNFSVSNVIVSSLTSSLFKISGDPSKIIGDLKTNVTDALKNPDETVNAILNYGKGGDSEISFKPLKSSLSSSERSKITKLVTALKNNKSAKATITIYPSATEKTAYSAKSLFGSGGSYTSFLEKRKSYIAKYVSDVSSRVTIKVSSTNKTLPIAAITVK